jgi:hypothetical protein
MGDLAMFIGQTHGIRREKSRRPHHRPARGVQLGFLDVQLGFLDLPGLFTAALSVILDHEGDLVAFVERPDTRRLEGSRMDEDVLRTVLRCDEAEALSAVEELDCSRDSHGEKPFPLRVS